MITKAFLWKKLESGSSEKASPGKLASAWATGHLVTTGLGGQPSLLF